MKQLELAIDKYRQKDPTLCIEIHMHPFQLNGLITETPIKRQDFGERKFGKARWDAINASLVDKFKSVGIDFQTDSYMSSSHLAHRLAALCADKKPEEEVSLAMDFYDMHHVQGIHCSDKEALARIAVKHGLFNTEQEAVNWLNSSEYDLQVKKCYQKAQQNGITGVPFFVFQDKYAASGAMGVDEFVQVSLSHSRASQRLERRSSGSQHLSGRRYSIRPRQQVPREWLSAALHSCSKLCEADPPDSLRSLAPRKVALPASPPGLGRHVPGQHARGRVSRRRRLSRRARPDAACRGGRCLSDYERAQRASQFRTGRSIWLPEIDDARQVYKVHPTKCADTPTLYPIPSQPHPCLIRVPRCCLLDEYLLSFCYH